MNVNPKIIAFVGGRPLFIPFATKSKVFKAPTISATQTPAGIVVTWSNVGADSYALQVSTDGGATFSALTTTANTSFTDTTASFPGSYTYRVQATKGAITSDWSNLATETMVDIPASPGGLTVTGATTSSISLSWNDTADETSYSIEASVDGLGSWSGVGSTGQNVVTFTHSGLAESVQRYYRVVANNKAGGSIPSSTTNSWTVPAAPTGLTATVISTTQIDLAWTDVSTGNQSYKVERSTDNVNWTEIATGLSATATTYSATGLTASTLYYFRVRAANAARNSDYSNTASATTQASTTVPNAPSGFTATSNFADSVSLSWTDNSSGTGQETGFDIEVSTNAGSTYSSVTTTAANATSYTHTGRVESTAYLYRIRATNSAGSSSWVVASSVTTPAALTNLTATAVSSTQINLAWTDKSGVETGFRIERSTDNTNWSLVTTTAANATSFSNTGLNASTLYYYRIRSNAYNGTNDSAWYSASATTQSGTSTYNVEYLVVAGGGGGATGGGGAGGYRTATGFSLTVGTSYTVTVGAGGAGAATTAQGNDGSNSEFSTITSTGGGGGGAYDNTNLNGRSGGSGGGAGGRSSSPLNGGTGGTGTSGQGNNGGGSNTTNGNEFGGGGGADAVGGTAVANSGNGGAGGAGKASSITGTSVTRGGGGGGAGGTNRGAGGVGGGGDGRNNTNTQPNSEGSANTGGGGGSGWGAANGRNGGSGVVIIRMATANYSGTTTGSPTVTTSGSDTILTYNASGTYTA